eukprot:COSAG01_NODE_73469_length_244_cov_22.579310_1_plen_24_part_01
MRDTVVAPAHHALLQAAPLATRR